jgi:aminoglycoside phosphotransferase family enzyme
MTVSKPEAASTPDREPDLAAKIRFLGSPSAHGGCTDIEVIETHMSWVFLVGDTALKMKKPVRYPMLDFSTLASRERHCRDEVRLNARLAPEIYRGVETLQWDGNALSRRPERSVPPGHRIVEWLVAMRRLPLDRMLHERIARHAATTEAIDAVVQLLAGFYRGAAPVAISPDAYAARMLVEQAANREVLLRPQFHLADAALVLRRFEEAVRRCAGLLADRCARGRIVEGHGDLRPEHVCLIDPPVIIDCIEFSAELRQVDPFDEIAQLGLECSLIGAPWIGPRLIAGIATALDDRPPAPLLHLYTARRALLRARLAMAHLLDPRPRMPERWVPLAQRCLHEAVGALDGTEPP